MVYQHLLNLFAKMPNELRSIRTYVFKIMNIACICLVIFYVMCIKLNATTSIIHTFFTHIFIYLGLGESNQKFRSDTCTITDRATPTKKLSYASGELLTNLEA